MRSTPQPNTAESDVAQIVAIGASAGGLKALESLFKHMPLQTGLAFVVVQHLSPDYESVLDEILARQTSIPIETISPQTQITRDHIYLMPAGKTLTLKDGEFELANTVSNQHLEQPITRFFSSLAKKAQHEAVAIILSGSGSDGSEGIRDIHQAGGLVLVQDPDSAQFDSMPQSAIQTECYHQILSPRGYAGCFINLYQKLPQ